jgi:hypothetical protein
MSNIIKFSINGDTNAEQVTEKVKKSVSALEKNIEGIENRFKSFGKDLFLSFAAPMVLLNAAMSSISAAIEKSKQDAREGLDLIAKGETKFATSEQKKQASFVKFKIAEQEEEQKVKAGAQKIYEDFLDTKEGKAIYDKYAPQFSGPEGEANMFTLPQMAKSQKVRDEIEQWFRDNQDKLNVDGESAKQKEAAESQIKAQKEVDKMPTTFKGPEGFSNVVGVGANPVLEAMASQLEEAKKTNDLLAQLVTPSRTNSWMDAPAGATSTAAPSRAAMLKGK